MSTWTSIVPIQTKGHKSPVFCVHGVGGEVLEYASLVARLPPDQPFIAFRAPGQDDEGIALDTIEAQAEFYVKELLAFRPDGPYLLCGYSHGGRVVLHMAQRLKARGKAVDFLGIVDITPSEHPPRTWRYP